MDTLTWAIVAVTAAAGLLAGGYVGVLITWLPAGQPGLRWPLAPAHCPHDDRPAATALIPPAGWLRLRLACAQCAGALGGTWLAAQVLTAAVWTVLAVRFGASPVLPAFCYLGAAGVALAFIDARYRRLPDALTLSSYPVALILLGVAAVTTAGGGRHFAVALAGLAGTWLLFALQAVIYPVGIGWGDVKLSGVLGLYLGWLGAGAVVAGVVLSYLAAAVTGLVLLATRRATLRSHLAFGPFLLAGTLAAIIITGLDPRLG